MKPMTFVVIVSCLLASALIAVFAYWPRESGIDCGPEGKPALNGTACIDREPVMLP